MTFVENTVITEIAVLPRENTIQVKWRNTIEKDGEIINAKDHYRLYGPGQQEEFESEVEGAENYVNQINWAGTEPDSSPRIPTVVSMRQARLALLQSGLLSAVNAAIDAAETAVQIEWEYATEVQRDNALVQSLAASLNLTDAQLDGLFTLAAGL